MRAGSLSQKDVVKRLERDYVVAWTNTEGEAAAGGSFAHEPSDPEPSCSRGNGEHNIQLLFLTPQGEIFHTLSGYLSAKELTAELDFGRKLFQAMVKAAPGERLSVLRKEHRAYLAQLEKRTFEGPLADWARRRTLSDHRFALHHALLPKDEFRTEMMVGRGNAFFGSSRGGKPDGHIGREPRDRLGDSAR